MRKSYQSFALTILTNILVAGIGFLSSLIIARILGPQSKGFHSILMTLPALLMTIFNLAFNTSSNYFAARKNVGLNFLFGSSILISTFISVAAIACSFVIIYFFHNKLFPGIETHVLYSSLIILPMLIYISNLDNILIGLKEIRLYNTLIFLRTILILAFINAFVVMLRIGFRGVIAAILLSFLVCFITIIIVFFKKAGWPRFDHKISKNMLVFGIKNYAYSIVTLLEQRLDIFFVNYFLGPVSLGFYALATATAEIATLVPNSIVSIMLPYLVGNQQKNSRKAIRLTVGITVLIAAFMITIGPMIIHTLFLGKFDNSIMSLKILSVATIPFALRKVISTDIISQGKPIKNLWISTPALVANIALNLVLIPKMGIEGAAYSSLASYTLSAIIACIVKY